MAAAKAGIRPTRREPSGGVRLGDFITAVAGSKLDSPNDLFLTLEKYRVGDSVNVTVLRDGKPLQTKITLEALQ